MSASHLIADGGLVCGPWYHVTADSLAEGKCTLDVLKLAPIGATSGGVRLHQLWSVSHVVFVC
jgi:hypothetical protein